MENQIRRPIGRILLDGKFVSSRDLDQAVEEQKYTRELLGQVLVRMGVLKEQDIHAPLLVQEHLSSIDDAVKIAAGRRQLLGSLLVRSGRITSRQLDRAIAEQKRTREKLGEVFIRLGMLTERQLAALLDFQFYQQESTAPSPLRLGELLVATGYISRNQLEDALHKQSISRKKIGEVLVQEGYVSRSHIRRSFRTQRMLVGSVLAAILSLSMSETGFAADVSLKWDANIEADLAGYKVYHSADSAPLEGTTPLDVSNQTTATISGLDPDKSYSFAVTAYNTSGLESTYSNIVSIVEQSPPTVDISSPADSVNVSGTVLISVNAADNVGVTKVEFYVNGVLKATDTGAPYSYSWDTSSVASGTYTLMVKAFDAAGNVGQSSRTVTVVNDIIAPTVALTSPANNSSLSGTVTISSSASDNVGVTNVEFYGNGVLLYASNVSPYRFNWDTTRVQDGVYSITAKAYDNAGHSTQSTSVTVLVSNPVPDLTAPTVSTFTLPTTATSLTVPVSGLAASDNIGVTGYLITESATAPAATASGWSATAPTSFTFSSAGSKTAYAWAKDAAGNVSAARTATVVIDATAPTVGTFTLPASATSLTVPVSGLAASDNIGVTGYLITESATAPTADTSGWSATAPATFTFSSAGSKTAYAWAKDAAGNVSAARTATVVIDATAPTVGTFTLPAIATSLTVPVSGLAASDNIGVTGYLITESATAPAASASGWSATAPTSFTFSSAGSKTAYAWAKDAAGNVSAARTATVVIDATAPTVGTFTLPAIATSLTVPVSGLAASDNIGVTGYLITESATAPAASASGWSATAPTSFTFSSAGSKTAYAWAKDAAGNVSAARTATVVIDATAPTVGTFTLPAIATSLTVPVSGLAASDNIGVTGYLITESATAPTADTSGWSATAPATFTFSSAGSKTAYAWAKDAAGNVSAARTATVVIDATAPTVGTFTLPAIATSLTVPVSGLAASDNIGVTGYLITESATAPAASASGWSATAPTSFTFSSAGSKTAYAWAKDAAGNVSAARTATVVIDATAPTVGTFTLPA
ncbi:MAG: Ig-like domain-containing protein, partial [Desulfuromonadaceae bacterium]|nr:Ig-like domain-containing protein [Desulfuromonadaceae bacterium]